MAIRSRPVQLKRVFWPKLGKFAFRVTGTIRGRQRCALKLDAEEAQAIADAWESERVNNHAAIRARATRLNQTQLSEAEAIIAICASQGVSPLSAVMVGLNHQSVKTTKKLLSEALAEFLAEKEKTVSSSQLENYRLCGTRFVKTLRKECTLTEVTTDNITAWLNSLGEIKKKTWNSYRNDLSAFFTWCIAKPRTWLADNPVEPVIRYKKKQTVSTPERLTVEKARELMSYLERVQPEWVCFFAVALFAGVRPDLTNGEIARFALSVGRDGAKKIYRGGKFHFPADMTKDGRARRTTIPPNLTEWLEKYPLSEKNLNPGNYYRYGQIRSRFKIPHDGLRHTCYSAFVAKFGSIAEATLEFGNSERIARDHYLDAMTKEEAVEFYSIRPVANLTATANSVSENS